jgi:hypothetical protein
MAQRKRRKPWNADLQIPGITDDGPGTTPQPSPDKVTVGHSTAPHFEEANHVCFRCERIREGIDVGGLDHTPRCLYRDTGRDPDPKG